MDYCYWTNLDPLNTTSEFGLSPSSISPASRLAGLEPFASPKEALALFQNHGYSSWGPPSATFATTILDQASFPPSVFVCSGSPSTYGSTESPSGEAQTTTLFDSSLVLVEQVSDKFDDTKLSRDDVDYGTGALSLPVAKSSIVHELLHDQCPVSALNTFRPVKPIKGMIRRHKQYLTVCSIPLVGTMLIFHVPEPRHDSPKRLHVLPCAFRTTIGLRPSYALTHQRSTILVPQPRLSDRPQVHPVHPLGRTTTSLGEARRVLGVVLQVTDGC